MTYSRSVAVLCFIVVMLIAALTPIGMPGPTTVDADHDQPATSHLRDPAKFPKTGGRIVRNVILGDPIPVCSNDLPISTNAAIPEVVRSFAVGQLRSDPDNLGLVLQRVE